jgi:hypothetical protein
MDVLFVPSKIIHRPKQMKAIRVIALIVLILLVLIKIKPVIMVFSTELANIEVCCHLGCSIWLDFLFMLG